MSLESTFRRRLVRFTVLGASMGVGFAVLTGAGIVVFRHSPTLSARPEVLYMALYPVGGAVGGALVAIFHPLTRWLGGAFLVGALAFLPLFLGGTLITDGRIGTDQLEIAVTASICLGGALGAAEWFNEPRRTYRLAHFWLFAGVCSVLAWFMGLRWAGQWPAVVAILLFLIPVAFALMATFAKADG